MLKMWLFPHFLLKENMKISSKTNPKIIEILKLKQKKYRLEKKQVLLEGRKVIQEAVQCGYKIECLIVTEQTLEYQNHFAHNNLLLVTENVAKSLSFAVTSQNIFAVINVSLTGNFCLKNKVLVVDKLQNPDNLGAIIRTAVATGFTDILAVESVDIFNDKTIRASMGNVFKVNFNACSYKQVENLLKDYTVFVADMDGKDVFSIKNFPKKLALVVGNEGNGVSNEMLAVSSEKISIPMQNGVESLNASVSAGIIMYKINLSQGE